MNLNLNLNACACMGPIADDPYCPCVMRNKGLTPTELWTPEKKTEFERAMQRVFGCKESSDE